MRSLWALLPGANHQEGAERGKRRGPRVIVKTQGSPMVPHGYSHQVSFATGMQGCSLGKMVTSSLKCLQPQPQLSKSLPLWLASCCLPFCHFLMLQNGHCFLLLSHPAPPRPPPHHLLASGSEGSNPSSERVRDSNSNEPARETPGEAQE